MFEDVNFDFDDDILLDTSFTPVSSSTQGKCTLSQKRGSQEEMNEDCKKLRLSHEESAFCKDIIVSPKTEKNSNVSVTSKVVKRKFPGPAGLLPERTNTNKSITDFISDGNTSDVKETQNDVLLCSQRTVSVFEDGPWKEMTKDFSTNGILPYEKFNISWIKRQACLKKLLVNRKAPFLAGVIETLEIYDGKIPTVNVTLKDSTGEIQSTVLHSLYEEYSNFFTIGSVLVLKEFGVLSDGYKNHCLTITPNNLVTIYCLETLKKTSQSIDSGLLCEEPGCVKKVVIQKCTVEQIMKKYEEDIHEHKNNIINFANVYKNHNNIERGTGINRKTDGKRPQSNLILPKSSSVLNRNVIETSFRSNILVETPHSDNFCDISVKKKFNFKKSEVQSSTNTSIGKGQNMGICQDFVEKSCDIIVTSTQGSSSQIFIKPDNKEHSEIWKKLLEDVDTDSLFDEF